MKQFEEIKEIASWCLNCKNRPCMEKGCPINTNIPEFIEKIKEEDYKKAYEILIENNIFSHICGIVCPQENQCEGSCIRGIKQTATKIGELEKFINEWAIENKIDIYVKPKEKNGKKIAVIGSGPAGLECAYELLKEGYDVTIFEKDNSLGGVLRYGIPDFRLAKKIVEEIISKVENLGAEIKTNVELGNNIKIEELQKEYNAVFLGIGATKSLKYSLSEEKLEKIYESYEFLKSYNENNFIKDLGTVVVIGGGNVAMDSARAAVRMGAEEVKILYRRDEEHMPAREVELKDCIEDGVKIRFLARVISANSENGKIKSLNCIKTEIINEKAVDVEDTEFMEKTNSIVFAIGLKPDKKLLQDEGIKLNDLGYIEVDEDGQTNVKGIFAGGDNTESKSTVCRAIAAGKRAAAGIIKNI